MEGPFSSTERATHSRVDSSSFLLPSTGEVGVGINEVFFTTLVCLNSPAPANGSRTPVLAITVEG